MEDSENTRVNSGQFQESNDNDTETNSPALKKDFEKQTESLHLLLESLRVEYMSEFHTIIEECDEFISVHDVKGLEGVGHRLKGNGASYGFMEISDIGSKMEELGRAGNMEEIPGCVEQLREICKNFPIPKETSTTEPESLIP